MKKTLLFFLFGALLCLLKTEESKAQMTSLKLSYLKADTPSHPCVPADLDYHFNGYATGTVTSSDTVTVKFYFDDGGTESYKIGISTSAKTFSFSRYKSHTYTTAGSYAPKVVVSCGAFSDSIISPSFSLTSACTVSKVALTSADIDTLDKSCIPSRLSFRFQGDITGKLGKYDSLTVNMDFGDGTFMTYKIANYPYSTMFFSSMSYRHTYTTAGTYTTKLKVSAPGGAADSVSSAPFTISTCTPSTKLSGHWSDSAAKCALPYIYTGNFTGDIIGTYSSLDTAIITIAFGDGTDTTFKLRTYSSSFGGSYASFFTDWHKYTTSGTYTPRVTVVLSSSGLTDTIFMPTMTLSDSCATITGKLYVDDDKDCTIDVGENAVSYIPIEVTNTATGVVSTASAFSDASGNYSVNLAAGTYKIKPMVVRSYSSWTGYHSPNIGPSCPSSGEVTLTVAAHTAYTRDFAYECIKEDSLDAFTTAYSSCFVTGDTSLMYVWASSYWSAYHFVCLNLPTTVTLTLDPKLTYASTYTGAAPASVVGKVLTWNLTGGDIASFSRTIKVVVSTSAVLGDTLKSTLYVAPPSGITDPNTGNNTFVHKRKVASSYDPNEKEAGPSGDGPRGFIAKNTPMTYTIHFQNTGTAPARNVVIMDTLESDLNAATVQMLSSTHKVKLYQTGNVLKFQFSDIYLPDSNANYYGSMGSVTFTILPKRDLAPGVEIKNRAAIYFDYNAPVITNYTLNTINIPTAIQQVTTGDLSARVFPNPANTELFIKMERSNNFSVRVTDMLGRLVSAQSTSTSTISVPTQSMPAGMYLVNIKDASGNEMNTKVVVKH